MRGGRSRRWSKMLEALMAVGLILAVVAIAAMAILLIRQKSQSPNDALALIAARLDSVALSLDEKLTQTRTDLAGRLEQVKGDLRQETSDRLGAGFGDVKNEVERQLTTGRQEQGVTLKGQLDLLTTQVRDSLGGIRGEIDGKLIAITERVQEKLDQNIKDGFAQFEKVQQHLSSAEEQLKNLGVIGASINDLNNLLKMPHLRGRFGEESLERLLEDFLPRHMYELQKSADKDSRARPDATIIFPDRRLPIDAKFPREQVLALFESSDPQALEAARIELRRVMKEQARRIAAYIHPEAGTTDMALMYLPSETLYMEAVIDSEVSEALNKLKVYPVSPNTLIVTLQSIQMVFNMYEYAKGHERATEELKKAQNVFAHFENKFEALGKSLAKAQEAFEVAQGHLSRYRNRVTGITGEPLPELDFPAPV